MRISKAIRTSSAPWRERGAATACRLLAGMLLALPIGDTVAAPVDAGAHALVEQALAAMGHGRDLHHVAAIRSTAVAANYDVVEFDHADPPHVFAGVSRLAVTDDLRRDRRLVEETPLHADPAAPTPTLRTLYDGAAQQTDTRVAGRVVSSLRLDAPPSWQTDEPVRALLLAERASDLTRQPDAILHGLPQHVLAFHHGRWPVRIYLDALSGLPSAIETVRTASRAISGDIAWNAWGDLHDRTELMNYMLLDGIRYPLQSDYLRNGSKLRSVTRATVQVLGAPGAVTFAMQPGAPALHTTLDQLALGEPAGQAPDPKKPIAEIAPGIVQIPGSWYSTIVRQDDGLVILDAPIAPAYAARVLAEAARRFPGLPVKAVVASTAFYWHMAGLREYAARGIPIYTRDRNVAVVRAMLAAPHTLAPDDLVRAPRRADVRGVAGPTPIGTGRHAIVVMPVTEGEQPMVMSWIADAHLLHTAEMVQPLGPDGALLYPESLLELKRSVHAAGIPTAGLRMIGMHMSPTPWDVLEQALRKSGG